MNIATVIVIMLIIAAIVVFIIFLVPILRERGKKIIVGKHVTNYLNKFTDGFMYGALKKMEPTGKDKDLLRITFTVKTEDKEGKQIIIPKTIIAKKQFVQENKFGIEILPRQITDLNITRPDYDVYKNKILYANHMDLIAEAVKQDKQKSDKIFIENYGGEKSRAELERFLELKKEEKEEEKK